jgi:hypothetical protein
VGLNDPNYHLAAFRLFLPRSLQHGVGLPDAGAHPEKDFQFSPRRCLFLAFHPRQQCVRVGPLALAHGGNVARTPNRRTLEAAAETNEDIVIGRIVGQAKEGVHIN